jgi:hypothetical protein
VGREQWVFALDGEVMGAGAFVLVTDEVDDDTWAVVEFRTLTAADQGSPCPTSG